MCRRLRKRYKTVERVSKMTLEQIRKDLNFVRYYYSRKKVFDEASVEIGACSVTGLVKKYNAVIVYAKPQLYDLYNGLYLRSMTQESFAAEVGYATDYVRQLNKKLLIFLQKEIYKEV